MKIKLSQKEIIVFVIWFILVCIWNFGVPGAKPIYDVLIATFLSLMSIGINKIIK